MKYRPELRREVNAILDKHDREGNPIEHITNPSRNRKIGVVALFLAANTLACWGGIKVLAYGVNKIDRIVNSRPASEVLYDSREDVSYTTGPGLVDNATGKRYIVAQEETERNPWDNLDYQVRTGRLVLEKTK